jgi:hypothetical protein
MKKLFMFIIVSSLAAVIFAQDLNFKAFQKWGNSGPMYGYKDAKGDVVVEPCFGAADDVKNSYGVISLTQAGPQQVQEFFIIQFTNTAIINHDTSKFRAYENFGKGFIKASNIASNTAQLTTTGSRVSFGNSYWGLFYKGKLILRERYSSLTLAADRINFSNGTVEYVYVPFDG